MTPWSYIKPIGNLWFNLLVYGSNKYLNFNTVSWSSWYGFRDNWGTMEYKNSLWAWTAIWSSSQTLATLPIDTNLEMGGFSLNTITANYSTALSWQRCEYRVDTDVEDIVVGTMSVSLQPKNPGGFIIGGAMPLPTIPGADWVHLWLYNEYRSWYTVILKHQSWWSFFFFNNPSWSDITLQPWEGIHYQYRWDGRWWYCADQFSSGGGSWVEVADEWSSIGTWFTILNFEGSGVTATDMWGGAAKITIPWGWLLPYTSVTSSGYILVNNMYWCDASAGPIINSLANGTTVGETLEVKKIDGSSNSVFVTPYGWATIDGETSIEITMKWESYTIYRTWSTFIII